jgi:hypothetical protein
LFLVSNASMRRPDGEVLRLGRVRDQRLAGVGGRGLTASRFALGSSILQPLERQPTDDLAAAGTSLRRAREPKELSGIGGAGFRFPVIRIRGTTAKDRWCPLMDRHAGIG